MKKPVFRFRVWLRKIRRRLFAGEQPPEDPKAVFDRFRKVLASNNQALEIITDLGEKQSGDFIFDHRYIEISTERLASKVLDSVMALDFLTGNRYPGLYHTYRRLTEELNEVMTGRGDRHGPLTLMFDQVRPLDWAIVGGKGAHLAEMRKDSLLRVPDGFIITTKAYHDLIDTNGLRQRLLDFENQLVNKDADPLETEILRAALESAVLQADAPRGLLSDIKKSLAKLAGDAPPDSLFLAIRSSAQEEDMDFSFAGQFQSVINVPAKAEAVFHAARQVIASLLSEMAVIYRKRVFPDDGQMSIAVVCQRMVNSQTSGIAFSTDTMNPTADTMVIVAAWGQGEAIVEGHVPTDTFTLSKDAEPSILERHVVRKPQALVQATAGGLEDRSIPFEQADLACLTDTQLLSLGRQILHLEKFYKRPQDIEWAIDDAGTIFILQARPLVLMSSAIETKSLSGILDKYETILADRGRVAHQGIGAGPVKIVRGSEDLKDIAEGTVLIAQRDSSLFVRVMDRVAAIVTEIGTPVSHMATVCREFQVPCLVGVGEICSRLTDGEEITVDAEDRRIYRGRVKELLVYSASFSVNVKVSKEFRVLRRLLRKVARLHLVDPLLQEFSVEGCRTYHDILRFIHEKAVMELVGLGMNEGRLMKNQVGRQMDLPIQAGIMVIDIGGGLAPDVPQNQVPYAAVTSVPFRAILQGMMFPDVWHQCSISVGMRDLMSSMLSVPTDTLDGRYSGYNIAIISADYVNLCFRFGYHFNIIDAHCSTSERDNHIYFRFLGGASDITKRSRRAMLIQTILEAFDFQIKVKGDLVIARAGNMVEGEMERTLDILGRLVAFTRQLDVLLDSDNTVNLYAEAFLQGNYAIVQSRWQQAANCPVATKSPTKKS